jgi:hypothetical protein
LAKSFVRARAVVLLPPTLQPPVLRGQRGGRRLGRFGFEHAVHLFMGRVVLGMPGAGKLDGDAPLQPPHAQAGQAERTGAAKRSPIVDPHDAGEPFALE